MSARFSQRAKLRWKAGWVAINVVRPTDLPMLARAAMGRKWDGKRGVRYSRPRDAPYKRDVVYRNLCIFFFFLV